MDLIIFDCDGVLVDSEVVANRAVAVLMADLVPGLDSEDFIARFAGIREDEILATVAAEHRVALPPDTLDRVEAAVDAALLRELEPIPGAAAALDRIALPKALASNSPLPRVERSLARTGLAGYFGDRLFCAEMAGRPKPAPDVYLLAARRLSVAPARCLVVEDSEAGVIAAVAAGMTVLGFTGASHIPPGHGAVLRRAGAADLVASMAALPERVAALGGA